LALLRIAERLRVDGWSVAGWRGWDDARMEWGADEQPWQTTRSTSPIPMHPTSLGRTACGAVTAMVMCHCSVTGDRDDDRRELSIDISR
jgi:hypothetical protein